MTRTADLPANVLTAASATSYRAMYALEIDTPTPVRICEGPGSLTIGGDSYSEGLLTVPTITLSNGGQRQLSVRISNMTDAISTDLMDQGLLGVAMTLYEVYWSAAGAQLDPVTLWAGYVLGAVCDDSVAEVTAQLMPITSGGMIGRIAYRERCGHVFKGARCQYAGGTTACNHSHATCTTLANTDNNGAFRAAPNPGQMFRWYAAEAGVGAERSRGGRGNALTVIPITSAPATKTNSRTIGKIIGEIEFTGDTTITRPGGR